MIASNGVNGASATAERPASGIQGDFRLSLFQARAGRGVHSRTVPCPSGRALAAHKWPGPGQLAGL